MLLLGFNQWTGPSDRMTEFLRSTIEVNQTLVSFSTSLPLQDALKRVSAYENAYNSFYTLGLTLSLISVSEIPDVDQQVLSDLGVDSVELLAQKPKDFSIKGLK